MKPVRVRLTMAWGPGPEIDAYPTPTPGLVVHRSFGQPDDVYTVTQQHSGIALTAGLPSPEAALALAADLGTLADWTGPVDEAAIRKRALRMARRWGWKPLSSPGLPAEVARAAGAIL